MSNSRLSHRGSMLSPTEAPRGSAPAARFMTLLVVAALGATIGAAVQTPTAWAQVNTSSLRGTVIDTNGSPVANAEVTLIHEPSSNVKVTTTNASGAYAFTGLRVGGPYQVTVVAAGHEPQTKQQVFLSAGKREHVAMTLQSSEVITVIGTAPTPRTTSSSSEFNTRDIASAPAGDNDIKSVIRLDPGVVLHSAENEMSINGINSRFNSVTIDGIRENDDFGLNNNGYPTQRAPISLNAVEQITVETSPFDVRYAQFLGGNVNIITKSGTNEFHGAVFGSFSSDELLGSKSGDNELDIDFTEGRFGLNLGGPIIKDKLHFFISAEGLGASTPISVGPAGSGSANEVAQVSIDDVARVQEISGRVYDFDAGESSQAIDEDDLKLLLKLDYAINEQHRLSLKYQRTQGNVINSFFSSNEILAMTSTWYNRDDRLHSGAVRLYSDWTDDLSTQLEFSGKIIDNRQEPLSGNEFMAAQILTDDGGQINIGPDVFRHANKLDTNQIHVKAEATYLLGQNLITGGLEYDRYGVLNLFVPFSDGLAVYNSIDDFESRTPASIFYLNAVTNDHNDGEVDWNYGVATAFLQDQIEVNDRLTVQGGARLELYQADDVIPRNDTFAGRYGFDNTSTVNGKVLVLPRAGLTFRPRERVNLRGGAGLYSGGTPNVWLSNNYSNDGISVASTFSADPAVINDFDGRDIPQALQDQLMPGDGNVNSLDPDFKIPSSWKIGAGVDYAFDIPALGDNGKDFKVKADYNFSKVRHALLWRDLRRNRSEFGGDLNKPVGLLADGRPYYDNDGEDGMEFNARRGHDIMLTNASKGRGHTLSVSLEKRFLFGLSLYAAYAWQNVKEVSPATGAVAFLAYGEHAVIDPNDPVLAISNYERAHRIVGSVSLSRNLLADITRSQNPAIKDLNTTISLFFESRSGQPFSYTFGGDNTELAQLFGEEADFSFNKRNLFYVPRGDGADRVILDGFTRAELNQVLADTGLDQYAGRIAPRNAFRSPWVNLVDLRFAQELAETRWGPAKLIFDLQNVGNLLNADWGQVKQVVFPHTTPIVDVEVNQETGQYIYSNLRTEDPAQVDVLRSVWRVQASMMFEF